METWAGFCMAWFCGTSPGGTVPRAPPLGNVTKDQAPQGLRNLMAHSHLPPSLPCLSPEPLPAQGQPPSSAGLLKGRASECESKLQILQCVRDQLMRAPIRV